MQLAQRLQSGSAASHSAVATRAVPLVPLPAPRHARRASQSHVAHSQQKLGDVSLFGDSTSSLLSGAPAGQAKAATESPAQKLEKVALESEAMLDYKPLRDLLLVGEWRQAEDETRAVLIKLAGEGAIKRNWVYFSEVKFISVKDFQTIDNLWKASSNGKFGFSVQREMWLQAQKRWPKFFKAIDWTAGENNIYRKWPAEFNYSLDAPKGHLPLTNALRGTQLFEAIMLHPAFDVTASKGPSLDERTLNAKLNL